MPSGSPPPVALSRDLPVAPRAPPRRLHHSNAPRVTSAFLSLSPTPAEGKGRRGGEEEAPPRPISRTTSARTNEKPDRRERCGKQPMREAERSAGGWSQRAGGRGGLGCACQRGGGMAALYACTKCHQRFPFEALSQGQQLCKVRGTAGSGGSGWG